MKIFIKNKGEIRLDTTNDFFASGGEGSIYTKNNTAFKIYHDPSKCISELKLTELNVLNINDSILAPKYPLLNVSGKMIGFTMDYMRDTVPLCKFFSKKYRIRNNITSEIIVNAVQQIQDTVNFIHSKNCLLVDANELNYIANNDLSEVFFIDVDSYKTPSFPPTAINPSTRDYHTKGYSVLSDWFSVGIILAKLFLGTHPFRGSHPNFSRNDIEGRMKNNISVFNKEVKVPPSVQNFSVIPESYKNWFIRMFENGERLNPPHLSIPIELIIVTPDTVINNSSNLNITVLLETQENIKRVTLSNNKLYAYTNIITDIRGNAIYAPSTNEQVIFTSKNNTPISVKVNQNNELQFKNIKTGEDLLFSISSKKFMCIDNRVYSIDIRGKFVEITINNFGKNTIASITDSRDLLPKSTQMFENFIYSNILQKSYLLIPYESGKCFYDQIPHLNGYKVISGKYEKNVCILLTHKDGKYNKVILKFSKDFSSYSCRIIEDVSDYTINFTCLEKGITAFIPEDGILEIFPIKHTSDLVKQVEDTFIRSDITLFSDGLKVMGYLNNKVYNISMEG